MAWSSVRAVIPSAVRRLFVPPRRGPSKLESESYGADNHIHMRCCNGPDLNSDPETQLRTSSQQVKPVSWSLPRTRAGEKAELPCAKLERDPYGRFNVTKNCTIVVANPLDWSVQSAYLLTIRSGVHNTRVKTQKVPGVMKCVVVYNVPAVTAGLVVSVRRDGQEPGVRPHGQDCSCQNGASCSSSDGKCNCIDGWYGRNCNKPCKDGRFGWRCQQVCACKNNATCSNVDGSCACVTPWTGPDCDQWQTSSSEPLLEILVSLGSLVLLVAVAMAILYKMGILACSAPDTGEEDKILFELRRMEQDLAQSLQPGWLGRWEKKIKHVSSGPLIGLGEFGQVRRAQLRTSEGELAVAAKTVRVEDSQSYRDFYREAAILVAVHKERDGDYRESNIVRLVGLITKSAVKYILLEYAPKGDLLSVLCRIRITTEEDKLGNLLGYAVHIARALQELERLRIAHRDVAARNVLITADDVAKLADFGLARDAPLLNGGDSEARNTVGEAAGMSIGPVPTDEVVLARRSRYQTDSRRDRREAAATETCTAST
uniref:Protein kinase domain-containing protein n=1 Tax=Branchiostoma floridae TaxID=7739 RepID=C3YM57_BRAFL|eukprot:XP_002602639.1 hypothetical protein BRAFLDRAFT_81919 [Branchiostoma floridae]